nr:hypothetical protein [Rhodothermus marinus]
MGPAGVTVVLIRDDFLQRRNQPLPTMLDYGTHAGKLFNTPPVFAVYIVEKVLRWLEGLGGCRRSRPSTTARRPCSTNASIGPTSIVGRPNRARARR